MEKIVSSRCAAILKTEKIQKTNKILHKVQKILYYQQEVTKIFIQPNLWNLNGKIKYLSSKINQI